MRYVLLCLFLVFVSCRQQKKYHDTNKGSQDVTSVKLKSILKFQEDLNTEYRDPETSPLPDKYRKNFEGLDFFTPDTTYVVQAKFERTPNAIPFLLGTTTGEKTREVVYGIAYFRLNGKEYQLEIYQSLDLIKQLKYKNYLFLPFLDESNGVETYGGGRYIGLTIPEGNTIEIDFNKAYNPYCVYNKKYSCPLVPRQNYLKTKVLVGVKDFVKK